MNKIRIVDVTLRDGMHAVSHGFTPDDMAEVAQALDRAGVDTIEVSHGDGLGGTSCQYGFAKASDEDYLKAVSQVVTNTKIDVLLLPGIGTEADLEMACKNGASVARIATHVTEASAGERYIRAAKSLDMQAMGFLMMSHMASPEAIADQARLFESYGADFVYVTDSAGAMVPEQVAKRIATVTEAVSIPVGFHAHNNMGLAVGNTLAAIHAGAQSVDGSLCGFGAGAGNAPTEVLAAVLDRMDIETGINLYGIMDAAEEKAAPRMRRPQLIDRLSLTIGWAGVYGSYLLPAERAAEKYRIDARDILVELGRRKTVGGQEDLIIAVASELAQIR